MTPSTATPHAIADLLGPLASHGDAEVVRAGLIAAGLGDTQLDEIDERLFWRIVNTATLLTEACLHLDPHQQGAQWPDPIRWDGRPLQEQARDICVLLDARDDAESARLSEALEAASNGLG